MKKYSLNFKNSVQKGSFRRIVFKEKDIWYAVALEFNIVVSADEPKVAFLDLFEAVAGYIESVKKSNSRPFALNQVPEKEYEDMWNKLTNEKNMALPSVFDFGISSISKVYA